MNEGVRVAFNIARLNYAGIFGSLIEFFNKKGHEVILLCDQRQPQNKQGYKAYLYSDVDEIRRMFPYGTVLPYRSSSDLIGIIEQNDIRIIFFLTFDTIADEIRLAGMNRDAAVIAYIQTGFDMMISDASFKGDVVYIFSDLWRQCWKKALMYQRKDMSDEVEDLFKKVEAKTVITGFPQLDQIKGFSREKICEKYGLPADKKILILLPFPWRVPFGVWSHIIYKPQSKFLRFLKLAIMCKWSNMRKVFTMADDRDVTRAIRQFADRNGAFFVVKGRLKNKVPKYLARAADKVVFDESYYPYTIMELLFVSDLCIHFYSDAIKECVAAGTPSICLGPTNSKDWECYARRFFLEEFSPISPSYYNFGSVSYNESVDSFAESFGRRSFEDYLMKPAEKTEFMKRFLGFDDLDSCSRVYDDVMQRLEKKKANI